MTQITDLDFKGMAESTKEWAYGHYCKVGESYCIYDGHTTRCVLPESLGMYTDKIDRYDKSIYTGDIVSALVRKDNRDEFHTKSERVFGQIVLKNGDFHISVLESDELISLNSEIIDVYDIEVYCHAYETQYTNIPIEQWGVHRNHCCKEHGCKYGDHDCPVVKGVTNGSNHCDICEDDKNLDVSHFNDAVLDASDKIASNLPKIHNTVLNKIKNDIVEVYRSYDIDISEEDLTLLAGEIKEEVMNRECSTQDDWANVRMTIKKIIDDHVYSS